MAKQRSVYQDYLASARAVGYLMILLGTIMLVPLTMLLFYPEERPQAPAFILPGVLCIFAGYLIKLFTMDYPISSLKKHAGSLIVLFIWLFSSLLGSIPFYLTGDYTITQAIFESTSGLSTTGFTVTDVTATTHMVLLYRSMLQFVGGVGLVLILTSLLSSRYGIQLMTAEGHTDRLAPSPLHSARTIMFIYLGFIAAGTGLFILFGMTPFDAVNYAMCAVSTGGFATHPESLGFYHSPFIDLTAIVLMFVGGTNFMVTMYLFKGRLRSFFGHIEVRCSFLLMLFCTPIVVYQLLDSHICVNIWSALDNGFFQVVSIMTTTGYTTIDNYLLRCGYALIPILCLMLIGGHADSTAGGIKNLRFCIAVKSLIWDVRENIFPNRLIQSREISRYGKEEPVTRNEQTQNYTYIFIYILILFAGSFGLMLCGYDFKTSFFEFASDLGNLGVSMGLVSTETAAPALWIIITGMIISRLGVYIFLLGVARILMDLEEQAVRLRLAIERFCSRKFGRMPNPQQEAQKVRRKIRKKRRALLKPKEPKGGE